LATARGIDKPISAGGLFPFSQTINSTPPPPYTDMGWPISPDGMYELLMRIERDYPQIAELAVTENGAAFGEGPDENGIVHDLRRVEYFRNHIASALRAVDHGSKLRSYYAWSFMDNFEWAEGYEKRFGLVHVDFKTLKRTPKESAKAYSAIIASNGALLGS
jgi:beta-glucosidase